MCGNYFYYQVTVVFMSCCQFTDGYYYYYYIVVVVVVVAVVIVIVFDVFVVGMVTSLRNGRVGLRIPVGARDFPFSKTSGLVYYNVHEYLSECLHIFSL